MSAWRIIPELAADPPIVQVTAAGVWPLSLDVSRYSPGGAVDEARVQLTDLTTDKAIDIAKPRLDGKTITAIVKGLTVGHDYRLVWTWRITPSNQPSKITIVRCVG